MWKVAWKENKSHKLLLTNKDISPQNTIINGSEKTTNIVICDTQYYFQNSKQQIMPNIFMFT